MRYLNHKIIGILTIVLLSCWVSLTITLPEFEILSNITLGIFILFFIIFIKLKWNSIYNFIKSGTFKYLLGHMLNIILTFSVLGLINFIVRNNDYYVDLTKNRLHTLSDQSLQAVALIDDEIKFELFASRSTWFKYSGLMNLYDNASKKLTIEFYDIDKEISKVGLYQIKEEGTLIAKYKGKNYRTIAKDELHITNLLFKILNPKPRKVYYSVGHNEVSFLDKNQVGADFLREKILNEDIEISPLELNKGIPGDANAIIILNPQIEFLEQEIKNLENYIENGGSLIVTFSPQFNGVIFNKFKTFISELGVDFENLIVLDRLAAQQGAQASIPIVNKYEKHPITEKFQERTLFPLSASFRITDSNRWMVIANSTPFPASWGEYEFDEIKTGKANYTEGVDLEGPLPLVVVGEIKESRIALFSSTTFISNQFKGQSQNFNFFLNTLNWTMKDDPLIAINRPKLSGNIVYISNMQMNIIFYFSILIIPFIFFLMGVIKYRLRLNS